MVITPMSISSSVSPMCCSCQGNSTQLTRPAPRALCQVAGRKALPTSAWEASVQELQLWLVTFPAKVEKL